MWLPSFTILKTFYQRKNQKTPRIELRFYDLWVKLKSSGKKKAQTTFDPKPLLGINLKVISDI
jgi:DNA-dependent RNA polymerase auxiliary subunit epsilon